MKRIIKPEEKFYCKHCELYFITDEFKTKKDQKMNSVIFSDTCPECEKVVKKGYIE
jgi:methionyl-tRNA synthetase